MPDDPKPTIPPTPPLPPTKPKPGPMPQDGGDQPPKHKPGP